MFDSSSVDVDVDGCLSVFNFSVDLNFQDFLGAVHHSSFLAVSVFRLSCPAVSKAGEAATLLGSQSQWSDRFVVTFVMNIFFVAGGFGGRFVGLSRFSSEELY